MRQPESIPAKVYTGSAAREAVRMAKEICQFAELKISEIQEREKNS